MKLAANAKNLLTGGFNMEKVRDAQQLYAGAQSLFKSFQHIQSGGGDEGLEEAEGGEDFRHDAPKNVILYSGCRDDQTSADAHIAGAPVGAMSWAFLETMKECDGDESYVDILRNTRQRLKENYSQIPQLTCGREIDLEKLYTI